MAVVIRIVGSPLGNPTAADGQYLRDFRPEPAPHGTLSVTADWRRAKSFSDVVDAHAFWTQAHGTRPDGRPNRPITAYTVELLTVGPFGPRSILPDA